MKTKISNCTHRPILTPCNLKNFDFQIDPYIGCEHYCYYCYALQFAETDWSKEILIHRDIIGQLSEELAKIAPQKIYMGYYTDPYQPCEADCRQTRKALELLLQRGFSASILTKSNLVVRDIDVLKEMNDASVSISVAFNDNDIRGLFEAGTIDTELRIEALHQIKEAGIHTAALICPVIPMVTDVVSFIDRLAPLTDKIWIYGLSIENPSDRNWGNLKRIFQNHFPEQQKEIEPMILSKNHPYWSQLKEKLNNIQESRRINLSIHL